MATCTKGSENADLIEDPTLFIPAPKTLNPLPDLAASLKSSFIFSKCSDSIPIFSKLLVIPLNNPPVTPNVFSILFSVFNRSLACFNKSSVTSYSDSRFFNKASSASDNSSLVLSSSFKLFNLFFSDLICSILC